MKLADIHTHIIAEVDDGASSIDEMLALIDDEYNQGVRILCCTPHFHPGYYGNKRQKIDENYNVIKKYVEQNYPDMEIYIGNELHYYKGCLDAIKDKQCRTINNTRYILVDFDFDESSRVIEEALSTLLQQGYLPIFAHVERYRCYKRKSERIEYLHNMGVIVQVNASSLFNFKKYLWIRRLLGKHIVDLIASDTHNIDMRPPMMEKAYDFILKKFGLEYTNRLFYNNAYKIINS